MTYLSVCSGIEAATVAWHPLGWTPVAFAEIDRFAAAVLAHHYPHVPNWGDMTLFQEWPDAVVNVLVGGTPCQSFSVASLRSGLADPRGNLALTYLAIAARYRPVWVVWENVPGVLSSLSHAAPDPCPPSPPVDLGCDGAEMDTEDVYSAEELHAFNCFLAGLSELGYGWAYRCFDAQHFRLAQRRRRVFVVGHLGDWRRAAAVLFERASLSGHPAPSREAREDVARPIAAGSQSNSGYRNDADTAENLIAFGGNNQAGAIDVATAVNAKGGTGRADFESETFIAHARRATGFDASEDGSGRGTPIVAETLRQHPRPGSNSSGATIAEPFTLAIRGRGDSHDLEFRQDGVANAILTPNSGRAGIGCGAIAFDTTQITHPENRSNPKPDGPSPQLAASSHPPAIAFHARQDPDVSGDVSHPLDTDGYSVAVNPSGMRVRRLTPRECERLQGFPDDYTLISYRGRLAKDGPRYKALGNSMAVPVMRWIGRRIDLIERVLAERSA